MADAPVVHIGENSPEEVAYKLLQDIARCEQKTSYGKIAADKDYILNTYAEALNAVRGYRQV